MLVVRQNPKRRRPRLRNPERTRERLLQAAFREVYGHGFQSAGIDIPTYLYGTRSCIAGQVDWRSVKEGTAGVIVRMSDLFNKSIGQSFQTHQEKENEQ